MTGQEEIAQLRTAGFADTEIQSHVQTEAEKMRAAGFAQPEVDAYYFGAPVNNTKANRGLAASVSGALAATAKNVFASTAAPLEAALNVTSGLVVGSVVGILGGAGAAINYWTNKWTGFSDEDPKSIMARYADAVTYAPRTAGGKVMADTLLSPLHALTRASEYWGEEVNKATGSAVAAGITEASLQVLPLVFLGSLGRRMAGKTPKPEDFTKTADALTGEYIAAGDPGTAIVPVAPRTAPSVVEAKLRDVYEQTGIDPQGVLEAARTDPTIIQDLVSTNRTIPDSFVTAYHGSPYDFTKFDSSRIGTGEGAQAYGHGLYIAESAGTARSYADALSPRTVGKDITGVKGWADWATSNADDSAHAVKLIDDLVRQSSSENPPRGFDTWASFAAEVKAETETRFGGKLYSVRVPRTAVEGMLDWDKPLSEQNLALANLTDYADMTGREFYNTIAKQFSGGKLDEAAQKVASQYLQKMGIPGIKYLDQGSRSSGEGTRNFVVFDENLIDITHKNGDPISPVERTVTLEKMQPPEPPKPSDAGGTGGTIPPSYSEAMRSMATGERKYFPIMEREIGNYAIPFSILEHGEQMAQRIHRQSLAELARRGGLTGHEALALIRGVHYSTLKLSAAEAAAELQKLANPEAATITDIAQGAGGATQPPTPPPATGAASGGSATPPPAAPASATGGGKQPPAQPPSAGPPAYDPEYIRSRIAEEPTKPGRTVRQFLDDMYTRVFDRMYPVPSAKQAAKMGVTFDEGIGPREALRLTAGATGKAKQFIELGTFDADTYQTTGPSLRAVLKLAGDDVKGFESYIVAKHAIEREAAGKATGIDMVRAQQEVDHGRAKFEAASQALTKYKDAVIDYAVKGGIIPAESVVAWKQAYQSHVPFYRLFEDEAARGSAGKSPHNPVMAAKGSERKILEPIPSIIQDTYNFIALAESNMARQKMLGLPRDVIERAPDPMRPIKVSDAEIQKIIDELGVTATPADLQQPITLFRTMKAPIGPNQIVIMVDGKRQVYKVDKQVAEAYNGLDPGSSDLLTGMASIMRAGVTLTPDFIGRNLMRDAIGAFINAGSHPVDTFIGGIALATKNARYQNWLKGGGANAAWVAIDRNYLQEHLGLARMDGETHLMQTAWNVVKTPFEVMRIVSEFVENATRLGAAGDIANAQTKAQIQALALISRESTIDFSRRGSDAGLNWFTRRAAFANPALLGIDRMARAFKDNFWGTTLKAFGTITMPSMLLWYANHDDQWTDPNTGVTINRWKTIPDWQRDLFWIVLTKDHIYRIPKPFEFGVLFGSTAERILDAWVDAKPDAFKHLGKSIANVFTFNIMPTAALPPFQQMTNFNFFTDRPLVSAHDEKILPPYQYSPYTLETTKALARIIGNTVGKESSFASPAVIDNYIRGWTGTLGTYAMQLADLGLRKTGIVPDPVRPTTALEDMPFVRAFMIRNPSMTAQPISDFYENYKKASIEAATINELKKRLDVQAMSRESALFVAKVERLEGFHKTLTTIRDVIYMVDQSTDKTADEKRQLIDNLIVQSIQIATAGNETLQMIKKAHTAAPTLH